MLTNSRGIMLTNERADQQQATYLQIAATSVSVLTSPSNCARCALLTTV